MKKIVIALVVLAAGIAAYKYFTKEVGPAIPPTAPLEISSNTGGFSGNFQTMLGSYYSLRDAFVKSDMAAVDLASLGFSKSLDSVDLNSIKADTVLIGTAKILKDSLSAQTKLLGKSAGLEPKRKMFQMISDNLFDLVRTVKYDKAEIFQINCPMAFDNMGANWLSAEATVVNPYFGDKMLHCGSVVDSVDYRAKP